MKKSAPEDVQKNFVRLQHVESDLEKKVEGYLSRTAAYDNYDEYREDHGGNFSITEKVRVSDAIKMYKGIVGFEKELKESPSIKAFSTMGWEDQLKGQRLLVENGIQMEIYADLDDGQIMIHNSVNNSHTIVEFKFAFDKDEEFGHVQLSKEGKEMFPMLESALRSQLLQNGAKVGLENKSGVMDHMSIDTPWMVSKVADLKNSELIIAEVANETGPEMMKPVEPSNERKYDDSTLGM
jgi:hypothetical protein